jgi:hypothetical protein
MSSTPPTPTAIASLFAPTILNSKGSNAKKKRKEKKQKTKKRRKKREMEGHREGTTATTASSPYGIPALSSLPEEVK